MSLQQKRQQGQGQQMRKKVKERSGNNDTKLGNL
jgi:hypothetical protein